MPTAEAVQQARRLLPKTPRQMAQRIAEQRAVVVYLQDQVNSAEDPIARAVLAREMQQAVSTLARYLAGASSRIQRSETAEQDVGLEQLDAATAKARARLIYQEAAAIKQVLRDLTQREGKGDAVARHRTQVQHRLLSARFRLLGRRFQLLQHGRDVEQYVKLAPGSVPVRRELGLPLVYSVPGTAETTVLLRAVAAGLQRRPGESDRTFRMRLKAYAARALVRYLNKRHSQQLPVDTAIEDAVKDTFAQDGAVIEAEVTAGGLSADPVADTMVPILDDINEEVVRVTEDMQPEVPEEEADVEDVAQVLAESEQVEAALTDAGDDMYDLYGATPSISVPTFGGKTVAMPSAKYAPSTATRPTTPTFRSGAVTSAPTTTIATPTVRKTVASGQTQAVVKSSIASGVAPTYMPSAVSSPTASYDVAAAGSAEFQPSAGAEEGGMSMTTKVLLGLGGIGLTVGLVYAFTRKKKA